MDTLGTRRDNDRYTTQRSRDITDPRYQRAMYASDVAHARCEVNATSFLLPMKIP